MSQPAPSRSRFGMLFVGVARRWRAALDASLVDVGLSDATWAPLVHIGRCGGGISQKELAARVGIDGSSLVRLLDILAAKDLIERRQDPDDRRSNLLFLKPAGKAAVRNIQRVLTVVEAHMLADLNDAEIESLTSALEGVDALIGALRRNRDGKS
jgi:MarR family transcriptional regulator, transcriptional regulator for hemolysin